MLRYRGLPRLISAIVVCQLAGVIGSIFTISSIPTWYAGLEKPFFAPPNWLFGPVWLSLYTLMGISLYLVWSRGADTRRGSLALTVFGVQLVLNALWSVLFFGLRSPILGLVEIAALWIMIAATIVLFYRVSRAAALLLIPYIAWVTIAAALNGFIWSLNL
ncbi:MAG: tryptophan-rich sensory protein [Thaumarchaeota archaeon]|nr:tryptophan-rich sensory protein [Nitrososphaerota archaeon]MCL5316791.1 tryptophan-rich sensory protein [Nitrososphaerota archaeon]